METRVGGFSVVVIRITGGDFCFVDCGLWLIKSHILWFYGFNSSGFYWIVAIVTGYSRTTVKQNQLCDAGRSSLLN